MKYVRTLYGILAACLLAGATSLAAASAPAYADNGFVAVSSGLNLQAGIDSGKVTLATTFFIPSLNVAATPDPTVDWGDGTVDTISLNTDYLASSDCYIDGVKIASPNPLAGAAEIFAALERCNLRGRHTYQGAGQYDARVTYYTGAAISYTTDVPVTVAPPRALVGSAYEFTPLAGKPFSGTAAVFVDDVLTDTASMFTASINWGDGSTSNGSVSGARDYFAVNGAHTYASAGTYTVDSRVSVSGGATVDIYSTAVVAAPPTGTLPSIGLVATLGQPITGALGSFVVSGTVIRPADYRASIDWGDGSPPDTATTIQPGTPPAGANVAYTISGTHTYAVLGQYTATVTLNTLGGGDPTTFTTVVLVTTCSVASSTTGAYATAVLASGPAGYWRLDSACAADASGHSLYGFSDGNPGAVSPGPVGAPALDVTGTTVFDGVSGAITLGIPGDPPALQTSNVSVEAWINSTHPNGTIVRKRFYGYDLYLDADGRPIFDINDANATNYVAVGPASVADGIWHYLVGTYDGRQVCLYVDGSRAGCAPAGAIHYAADEIAIGRDGSALGGYFTGSIDEVAIYPKALTADEVSKHFAVSKQATSTTLAQSGQKLVATITGAGGITPTGTVTFKEGTVTLGTATLSNGSASLPLSGLPAGNHTLLASYSGDINSAPSSSAALSITVAAITTTTTVATSDNNAPHFASITFTATVQAHGSGAPTGSVAFMADGAVLGTATLTNGVATFTAKPGIVSAGVHHISAAYSGDGRFGPSQAQPIQQIVQGAG